MSINCFNNTSLQDEFNRRIRDIPETEHLKIAYSVIQDEYNELYYQLNEMKEEAGLHVDSSSSIVDPDLAMAEVNARYDQLVDERKDTYEGEPEPLTDEKRMARIERLYAKSLENEYSNSLERLIGHKLNFQRLIRPNDASLLKGIAAEIRKLRKLPSEDTTSATKYLDSLYVSDARHNFVTGRNALAIAAVSQTGHSLRQRVPVTVDPARLAAMDPEMREWLGNGKLAFPDYMYNTVNVNGKNLVSLSGRMTRNKNYFISDNISQVIDGAADVAKGAWIIDYVGDVRKIPTALFMMEIGFDPHMIAYFLNQPIIEDYMNMIDNAGYNWLFIDDFVQEVKAMPKYNISSKATTINTADLKNYISAIQFSNKAKEQQNLILDEFLKLSKMASHLFAFTQGTNWDTTDFTDPYIVYKKSRQLEKARTSIFSSADAVLEASFLKNTQELVGASRDAVAQFLPIDGKRARDIIQEVLDPYIDLPNDQFVSIAQKIVNSFVDYAIHTKFGMGALINSVMVDKTNAVQALQKEINALPMDHELRNNPFIKRMKPMLTHQVNNLTYVGKLTTGMDQNLMIAALQEIRDSPALEREVGRDGKERSIAYSNLVKLCILQGIGNSPVSFTQLMPVEDMKEYFAPVFNDIDSIPNLEKFSSLNAFQRNFWNDPDIVPYTRQWKKSKRTGTHMIFSKLPKGAREAFDNQVAVIDSMNRVSDSDIIVISFDKDKDEKNIPYTRERKEEMNKAGDYSYIQKMLMKRVYDGSKPFYTTYNFNGQERTNYYYKAINAWGDSFRLQEYYSQPKQSKVDNGFHKIDIEFSDSEIRDIITDKPVITSVPVTPAPVEVPAGEGFQGYKSGFSIKGRGTPEGDGKDQAMRQVAHGVITELANPPKWLNKDNTVRRSAKKGDSSSATSIIQVVRKEEKEHGGDNIYNPVVTSKGNTYAVAARSMESPVYMLARNSEFSGKPLDENTKFVINAVKDRFNATFVVGDQPGVDSPFIDYLKEIGATFTIYHAGPEGTSRTKVEDKGAFPDKPLDIQPGQCG